MSGGASPVVPVSWGELIDKITILAIKRDRLTRPEALANVSKELRLLSAIARPMLDQDGIEALTARLRAVNEALWEIEDAIREQEAAQCFGAEFIRLARSVYLRNDERAALKREINLRLQSDLHEEKSYAEWRPAPERRAGRA